MDRWSPQLFFRSRQDGPASEGWHYGRYKTNGTIMPYFVYKSIQGFWVAIAGTTLTPVTEMHWFGPVPEVKEASSP
jgi:hypothetical protein